MKKILTVMLALCMVAAFTVPAAADPSVDFEGSYRVRGFLLSNPSLQADQDFKKATGTSGTASETLQIGSTVGTGLILPDSKVGIGETASQSWMDMRFRLQTTFTAADNLQVVTRFDALDDKKWGDSDNDTSEGGACPIENDNIDFDRAYMVITPDFGKFTIGRQWGGTYGNLFLDTDKEADRLRFDTKLDNLIITAIFEKNAEVDSSACLGTDIFADTDADAYYLALTYKTEDLTAGLLTGYHNVKIASDAGLAIMPYDRTLWLFDPFFDVNMGDINVKGEAQLRFGKYAEYDRDVYGDYIKALDDLLINRAGIPGRTKRNPVADVDYDAYAWNLEGTYTTGPMSFQLGYAWVKGEDNVFDDKHESVGGLGDDWGKAWILAGTDGGFDGTLGNHAGCAAAGATAGNLSSGSTAALNGVKMVYLSGSYQAMDNLKVTVLYANSKSESPGKVGLSELNLPAETGIPSDDHLLVSPKAETCRDFASDHGSEYDLTVEWDLYDNLNYQFIAAYLDVGDYWQFGNPYRELENVWTFWQQLTLNF